MRQVAVEAGRREHLAQPVERLRLELQLRAGGHTATSAARSGYLSWVMLQSKLGAGNTSRRRFSGCALKFSCAAHAAARGQGHVMCQVVVEAERLAQAVAP